MDGLRTLYLHLTSRCNLSCRYCYQAVPGTRAFDELTTDQITTLFHDLPLVKPETIVFTGGEPLMRDDLECLAKCAKQFSQGSLLRINSNGCRINSNNAYMLVDLFDEIRISVDGPEIVNDALRGKGSFWGAMEAIRNILNAGGNPVASITATTENLPFLDEFIHCLMRYGVGKIHVAPVRYIGNAEKYCILCGESGAPKAVSNYWHHSDVVKDGSHNPEFIRCGLGYNISINPDGFVFPCHVLTIPELCLGNIKDTPLSTIIKNEGLFGKLRRLDISRILSNSDSVRYMTQNDCPGIILRNIKTWNVILKDCGT